jgi:hypothetical protein
MLQFIETFCKSEKQFYTVRTIRKIMAFKRVI